MIRTSVWLVLGAIFLSANVTDAHAWDKQRKGFVLGLGGGPALTSINEEFLGLSSRRNKLGLYTDFRIGYAPENNWMICYINKVSWFGSEVTYSTDFDWHVKDMTIMSAITGVGFSYYFNRESPSPFVTGGVGASSFSFPFEDLEGTMGAAFFAGGGYEFTPRWSFEGNFTWGNPSKDDVLDRSVISISGTINILGY